MGRAFQIALRTRTAIAAILLGGALAGCATSGPTVQGSKPVDAYILLGQEIKACWFAPDKALLKGYVYQAVVAPDGEKVQISIHEMRELGRAGYTTFVIDLKRDGGRTKIESTNRKMPPELDARMKADLARWQRGDSGCSDEKPAAATAAAPKQ